MLRAGYGGIVTCHTAARGYEAEGGDGVKEESGNLGSTYVISHLGLGQGWDARSQEYVQL